MKEKVMPEKDIFDLLGRVALVTGGGRGLGREICEAMAEFGADIACNDINKEAAEEVVEYAKSLGRRAIAVQADVTKENEVNRMLEEIVNELGVIDIAFCSPAEVTPMQRLHEMPLEVWDRCVMNSPNLRGGAPLYASSFTRNVSEEEGLYYMCEHNRCTKSVDG